MTRDELAERLYDADDRVGEGAWKRLSNSHWSDELRERYRRIADDVLRRLHAEHYSEDPMSLGARLVKQRKDVTLEIVAPVERVLDEIDGGPSGEGCGILDRVRAIGERLSRAEKRKNVVLEEMQSVNDRRLQELADIESALCKLDGGALGTLADRVRAIPGLVRARALRANADYGKGPTVKVYDVRSAYPSVHGALQNDRIEGLEKRCQILLEAVNRRADEIDRIETILLQWEKDPSSRVASNMLAEIRTRHDADFPRSK